MMNLSLSDVGTIISLGVSIGSFVYYYAVLNTKVEYLSQTVRRHEEKWEDSQKVVVAIAEIKQTLVSLNNALLRLEGRLDSKIVEKIEKINV